MKFDGSLVLPNRGCSELATLARTVQLSKACARNAEVKVSARYRCGLVVYWGKHEKRPFKIRGQNAVGNCFGLMPGGARSGTGTAGVQCTQRSGRGQPAASKAIAGTGR